MVYQDWRFILRTELIEVNANVGRCPESGILANPFTPTFELRYNYSIQIQMILPFFLIDPSNLNQQRITLMNMGLRTARRAGVLQE